MTAFLLSVLIGTMSSAFSAEGVPTGSNLSSSVSTTQTAATTRRDENPERTFEATLRDLLLVFGRDLDARALNIRNDVTLRRMEVKGDIPASYRNHLRSRVAETLLRSSVGVVAKPSKQTRLVDAQLYLDRQKMVLSVSVTDSETLTLQRQMNYDSEEWKAGTSFFKLNLDKRDQNLERVMQYPPSILYGARFSIVSLPDLSKRLISKEIALRALERFSSRRYELGFELSSVLGGGKKDESVFSGFSLQNTVILGRSFLGTYEDYDRLRFVGYVGIGGYYADGLIGALWKMGVDTRIGKSFAIHTSVGYRPKATNLLSSRTRSLSGVEAGVGIVWQFETYGRP